MFQQLSLDVQNIRQYLADERNVVLLLENASVKLDFLIVDSNDYKYEKENECAICRHEHYLLFVVSLVV